MNKNFKSYLFLKKLSPIKTEKILLFLLIFHNIFSYAMNQPSNAITKIKIEKAENNETKLFIPKPIENSLEQFKKNINDECKFYSDQINVIRKNDLQRFKQNCGLTPENWNFFIQEAKKIPTHSSIFTTPPCTFQQHITPDIPPVFLKSLETNCINLGIYFKKIHIRQPNMTGGVHEFSIHTPFYSSLTNSSEFTFSPDILTLNPNTYNKNPHFFNICIATAFKQEIARIEYFFYLVYQNQIKQPINVEAKNLPYFDVTRLFKQINAQISLFILSNFRTSILDLILRNRGAAEIVEICLTTNPALCNRYGITNEDHAILKDIIYIDSLKLHLQQQQQELKEKKDAPQDSNLFPQTQSLEQYFFNEIDTCFFYD